MAQAPAAPAAGVAASYAFWGLLPTQTYRVGEDPSSLRGSLPRAVRSTFSKKPWQLMISRAERSQVLHPTTRMLSRPRADTAPSGPSAYTQQLLADFTPDLDASFLLASPAHGFALALGRARAMTDPSRQRLSPRGAPINDSWLPPVGGPSAEPRPVGVALRPQAHRPSGPGPPDDLAAPSEHLGDKVCWISGASDRG